MKSMTRIAIISDVHCHHENLKRFLRKEKDNIDIILSAGDIVGYRYQIDETIELFEKHKIQSIKGNHDKYALKEIKPTIHKRSLQESIDMTAKYLSHEALEYLRCLPDTLDIEIDGIRVILNHGSFESSEEYLFKEDILGTIEKQRKKGLLKEAFYFFGHTHLPYWIYCKGIVVANPGSIGFPKKNAQPSYIIIDSSKCLQSEEVKSGIHYFLMRNLKK